LKGKGDGNSNQAEVQVMFPVSERHIEETEEVKADAFSRMK
jgi:hypothetical protein